MTNKEKVYSLIILLGLIVGMINMYVVLSKALYRIDTNTEILVRDHRSMQCTIATTKDNKNIIVCYPSGVELESDSISL